MNSEELLTSLRTSHQEIVDSIDQIQPLLRSYSPAKARIREMHKRVLDHFGRQTGKLFDELRAFYKADREALKLIEFLIHDLKDVKIKYLVFADEHSGELSDVKARSFPKDFSGFSSAILGRIKIEEEYLFPLLEKLP